MAESAFFSSKTLENTCPFFWGKSFEKHQIQASVSICSVFNLSGVNKKQPIHKKHPKLWFSFQRDARLDHKCGILSVLLKELALSKTDTMRSDFSSFPPAVADSGSSISFPPSLMFSIITAGGNGSDCLSINTAMHFSCWTASWICAAGESQEELNRMRLGVESTSSLPDLLSTHWSIWTVEMWKWSCRI